MACSWFHLLQPRQMRRETLVRPADQFLVEPRFVDAALVTGDQQDRLTRWIEGKGEAPYSIGRGKPKLLHVRVMRAFQSVAMRTLESGAELLEKPHQSRNLLLHLGSEVSKLGCELVGSLDLPGSHSANMP